MKKNLLFLAAALVGAMQLYAQSPDQLLTNWSANSPIEKIHLHFDRDNYIAGETAWFKAYLASDYQPDTISTSLYAELLNDSGRVINRCVVPVLLGTAYGSIAFPETLMTGAYIIRAYTATMLNQDPEFVYKRNLFIYGKNPVQQPREKMLRIEFFPEGGNFITGFPNSVAFKATDEYGMPVNISGALFNEKQEKLSSFNSVHDGMGLVDLTPVAGEKYYVIADGDAQAKKYYLPESTTKGIALSIIPHPQGSFFELHQSKDDPAFQVAYMIGQMQHHVVFRSDFKTVTEEKQGVINTQNLNSGILQVTFFNKNNQPLAERLCFVDNKEYLLKGELVSDTISFSAKARNRLSIALKDTVRGSFSVSVSDAAYDLKAIREDNIISRFLLTSDLKGYVHNPAYYFSADNDSVKAALDLLMMTHGWRRFKWNELATRRSSGYKDGGFITISGKINLRDSKRPFASKPFLLMLIGKDSTRKVQMLTTDETGAFRLDSLLLFGNTRIFVSDIRGKKSQYIDVLASSDSIRRSFQLPLMKTDPFRTASFEQQARMGIDFDDILRANGLMMQGVTVKATKKSPLQALDEKYAKGAFSGNANKSIDLVNSNDAHTYMTIFDYLQTVVPSLQVGISDDGATTLYYRQGLASVSSMGLIPMVVYLDEVETDASVVAVIPPAQIAMVKVFSSLASAPGNGAGGVLAIYTKDGEDMRDAIVGRADMMTYNGYSIIKEFYEPDYKANPASKERPDNRITLSWRPGIILNNIDPKVPVSFYNSDRTKSFRVVVEGMTVDGKMLMIEKIITPETRGF